MRRVRVEKPKGRRDRRWTEVLPLDPRDPDVARAKAIGSGSGVPVRLEEDQTTSRNHI